MAIRSAVGAARGRLLRQTLTESALLTAIGAALSWIVVQWLTRSFVLLAPSGIPRLAEVSPDWRVGMYTLLLALVTAIAAGWLPALASSRVDLQTRLTDASRGSASTRGARLRSLLVVAEVTLAVVLAFGTGLLVRSFVAVLNVDPGFETSHVLSVQVTTPRAYGTPEKRREFYRRLFARLEAVPGVTAVGGTTRLPLGGADSNTRIAVEGRDTAHGAFDVGLRRAMHDYFTAMQIPIVRGRGFTAADGADAPRVVLVNQALAARVFPGEDPIGRRMDDITPLQQLSEQVTSAEAHLFDNRVATQWLRLQPQGTGGTLGFRGENPTRNAAINYYLGTAASGNVRFEITDVTGQNKRTLTVPARAGINRLEWNMTYDPTPEQLAAFQQAQAAARGRQGAGAEENPEQAGRGRGGRGGPPQGDPADPGEYRVTMTVNGKAYTSRLTIRPDPLLAERR